MGESHKLTNEEIAELVASKKWYHKFQASPGIITPGRVPLDAKVILDSYGFPQE